MNTSLLRHGFILILLALIGGFLVSAAEVPRLAVSAHTIGLMSGILLIALGAVWAHFSLSSGQALMMKWSWLYSSYANWLGCFIGGMFGAGGITPVAAGAYTGTPLVEGVVAALLISVGVVALVAVGLSLWGLRRA